MTREQSRYPSAFLERGEHAWPMKPQNPGINADDWDFPAADVCQEGALADLHARRGLGGTQERVSVVLRRFKRCIG